MNKFCSNLILGSVLLLITSCDSFFMGKDYEYHEGWARVEDYVVGSEYKIISVDGEPAIRQKHGKMVTVVPLVIIPEGEHILTIKIFDFEKPEALEPNSEISVNIEKDGYYRLKKVDGVPKLVDIKEK